MSTTPTAPLPTARPTDFADLVNLLAALSKNENNLALLQQTIDRQHLGLVEAHMTVYKEIQTLIGECDAAIKVIGERNPQWFDDKKTIATPYGEVKRTTSTSLEIADEEISLNLIRAAGRAGDFIKTTYTLSKEALEALTDDELKKFGIKRVTEHNYKASGASVDLGKSVKAAERSAKAAAKAAKAAAGGVS